MEKNSNNKVKIEVNKSDIQWIRDEITEIKNNHLGSIYERLGSIEKRVWINTGILTIFSAIIIYLISK